MSTKALGKIIRNKGRDMNFFETNQIIKVTSNKVNQMATEDLSSKAVKFMKDNG